MDLFQLLQCYKATGDLGLTEAHENLEKTIGIVSKQILKNVKPVKEPKEKKVENEEAIQETPVTAG